MTKEISYFQFRAELGYPVFVRIENPDLEFQCEAIFEKMGFSKLDQSQFKEIQIINKQTKILSLKEATIKTAKQIDQIGAFDSYGPESITEFATYDVYRYKGVGIIMMGHTSPLWEAAVKNLDKNEKQFKALIVRFLSHALAPFGVVGFWGVPVDEGFVIMRPQESNYESIFVDLDNNAIITLDGIKDISFGTQVLRLDESLNGRVKGMKKEELVSFLSTKTTYLSQRGLDARLRSTAFELASIVDGYVYPSQNFKPRSELES